MNTDDLALRLEILQDALNDVIDWSTDNADKYNDEISNIQAEIDKIKKKERSLQGAIDKINSSIKDGVSPEQFDGLSDEELINFTEREL